MSYSQCIGVSRSGSRCQRFARNGTYCLMHDPERADERERWREKLKEGVRRSWSEARAGRASEIRGLFDEGEA